MKILVIDNYDSFTYNLVQYIGELELGKQLKLDVVRNDQASVDELLVEQYDRVVISPGPCSPDQAGITLEAAKRFPEADTPLLGVCLGHQALVQAFGGEIVRHVPVHGKPAEVSHSSVGIFTGLESPLTVGRYHSLVAKEPVPECFKVTASGSGVVMAVEHKDLPAYGLQFHPESILTPMGHKLLSNFLVL